MAYITSTESAYITAKAGMMAAIFTLLSAFGYKLYLDKYQKELIKEQKEFKEQKELSTSKNSLFKRTAEEDLKNLVNRNSKYISSYLIALKKLEYDEQCVKDLCEKTGDPEKCKKDFENKRKSFDNEINDVFKKVYNDQMEVYNNKMQGEPRNKVP